jgi:hypothetical protein
VLSTVSAEINRRKPVFLAEPCSRRSGDNANKPSQPSRRGAPLVDEGRWRQAKAFARVMASGNYDLKQ